MFDRMMFWVYCFSLAYHSIRGHGNGKCKSLKNAYTAVYDQKMEKPISEFQTNMWKAMKEIAKEGKL